jgi:hypothetical protein
MCAFGQETVFCSGVWKDINALKVIEIRLINMVGTPKTDMKTNTAQVLSRDS